MADHFDWDAEDLKRLRGPIGVYIGSKTPPEIAISIMAEILAVKNGIGIPCELQVAGAKYLRSMAA